MIHNIELVSGKCIRLIMLTLSAYLSSAALAGDVEEVHVYGTQPNYNGGNPSYNSTTPSTPTGSGMNYGPGYAEAQAQKNSAAVQQQARVAKCNSTKTNVPIEQAKCKAMVNTVMVNYNVASCSPTGGTFAPEFPYNGSYFQVAFRYPAVQYTTSAQCDKLTNAAIAQFQSDCSTTGDQKVVDNCEGVKQ
ncbi:MAG TPA: hypothetical protein VL995_13405 [Cellvibrio sp.]|nr:hypothetical protein [Cellvibrio sp.]